MKKIFLDSFIRFTILTDAPGFSTRKTSTISSVYRVELKLGHTTTITTDYVVENGAN